MPAKIQYILHITNNYHNKNRNLSIFFSDFCNNIRTFA